MSKEVRDVFVLVAALAVYGGVLWLYERAAASQRLVTFTRDPRLIFARDHDRERMIEGEMSGAPAEAFDAD